MRPIVAQENAAGSAVLRLVVEALTDAGYKIELREWAVLARGMGRVDVMVGVRPVTMRSEVLYPRGQGLAIGTAQGGPSDEPPPGPFDDGATPLDGDR